MSATVPSGRSAAVQVETFAGMSAALLISPEMFQKSFCEVSASIGRFGPDSDVAEGGGRGRDEQLARCGFATGGECACRRDSARTACRRCRTAAVTRHRRRRARKYGLRSRAGAAWRDFYGFVTLSSAAGQRRSKGSPPGASLLCVDTDPDGGLKRRQIRQSGTAQGFAEQPVALRGWWHDRQHCLRAPRRTAPS